MGVGLGLIRMRIGRRQGILFRVGKWGGTAPGAMDFALWGFHACAGDHLLTFK